LTPFAKTKRDDAKCLTNLPSEAIWIVDAHRDGKRFIVHADEKLTAFMELERAIYACGGFT
jgi:hypothetical protein